MSTSVVPTGRSSPGTLEKSITLFIIIAPFVAVASIPFVWEWARVTAAMVMFPVFYVLTVQAITISFHRELTHDALRLRPVARLTEAVLAMMSIEGTIKKWVAKHRKHHKYTDEEGDPHSPLHGFFHAHFGWFFKESEPEYEKWIPKLLQDRRLMLLDKLWPMIAVSSFVLPGLLTLIFEPSLHGFLVGVFWGGFVRVFFVHHVTWSINSLCHMWGSRPFHSDDESANNPLLAPLSAGEAWHRNHHAFPWSARIGLRWWEIDWGWMIIRILDFCGQVEEYKVPTRAQIEAKRIKKAA